MSVYPITRGEEIRYLKRKKNTFIVMKLFKLTIQNKNIETLNHFIYTLKTSDKERLNIPSKIGLQ